MSLALEMADAIREAPVELLIPRSCKGCMSLDHGCCTLWAGDCVNSPYKPYWRPKAQRRRNKRGKNERNTF